MNRNQFSWGESILMIVVFALWAIFMLSITPATGRAAGHPGDTGISYLNNTAYLGSVEQFEDVTEENWILRTGTQDDWNLAELGFYTNRLGYFIFWNHPEHGWIWMQALSVGVVTFETRWAHVPADKLSKLGLNDDIYMKMEYCPLSDKGGIVHLNLFLTEYKITAKNFIEMMILDMMWADYNEGQEGR